MVDLLPIQLLFLWQVLVDEVVLPLTEELFLGIKLQISLQTPTPTHQA